MMLFSRGKTSTSAKQVSQTQVFPAPLKGWIKNESLAVPSGEGAEVLDNWFPTAQGVRMRKGSVKKATCDADKAIGHLATYETGLVSQMFGCDSGAIYDVTPDDVSDADTALTALVTGMTSADWSSVQFSAGGGIYLVMVNGADTGKIYNGVAFGSLASTATYSLKYDAQTAAFTVGSTLTGGTSGATGTIAFDDDGGATGTLYLTDVTGTFEDNETITDAGTGSATANGAAVSVYAAVTFHDETAMTTADLSAVWAFKNRMLFIEGGTLNAWYLPSLSIGGEMNKIDLGGVFQYGGTLLFGGTFSRDAGSGLDDFCIFVTENGEIAVYQGNDPSSATDFSLVGVYKIGKPLGKNASFKAGGDMAISTDDGIVSVAAALDKDRAGITPITYPIEEAWRTIINERAFAGFPFQTVLWQKQSMLVVAVPAFSGLVSYCLVANSKTGAWARYTGIDMRSVAVLADKCYFGTQVGTVIELETGGADQDVSYAAVCIPRFDMIGTPAEKSAVHQRIVARTNFGFSVQLFASADYVYDIPAPLQADPDETDGTWGSGIWGTTQWGGVSDTKKAVTEWQSVAAFGHALSPCVQISSGRDAEPDFELIGLHLQYVPAEVMV